MNFLENFHRMMQRQGAEWMPFDLQVTAPVADLVKQHKGTRDLIKAFDLDFDGVHPDYRTDVDAWKKAFAGLGFALPQNVEIFFAGITHAIPAREDVGAAYHFREMLHPLSVVSSVDQLKGLPWPDWSKPGTFDQIAPQVQKIHAQNRVAVGWLECTIFEFSWYLRGMDNLCIDLADENGIADFLLDWFTQRSVLAVSAFARAGADVIALGDDIGTQRGMMMSVEFWRRHLKPRLKKVIDAIRANQQKHVYVRYHSDGDIRAVIPELAEIGVDILNPLQPECMPLAEVIPQYKDRLAFWGMVGTQTTMPFGTPQDVRRVVDECASWSRQGARIIVAPTHVLEPEVPWSNIEALVDAVRSVRL